MEDNFKRVFEKKASMRRYKDDVKIDHPESEEIRKVPVFGDQTKKPNIVFISPTDRYDPTKATKNNPGPGSYQLNNLSAKKSF